jgi:hypothetical protein
MQINYTLDKPMDPVINAIHEDARLEVAIFIAEATVWTATAFLAGVMFLLSPYPIGVFFCFAVWLYLLWSLLDSSRCEFNLTLLHQTTLARLGDDSMSDQRSAIVQMYKDHVMKHSRLSEMKFNTNKC